MINPFLETLFQDLFSARQQLVIHEQAMKDPIASVGGSTEIIDLLRTEEAYPERHESLYKIDKMVRDIADRGNYFQIELKRQAVKAANKKVSELEIMIENYMEIHYTAKKV